MYKKYPTKAETPSRMARKHARRDIFVTNKKTTKLRKKLARAARNEEQV